jgi:hypothetical protein
MVQLDDQSIFFNFKSSLLLTNEFFINKELHNLLHNETNSLISSPN